MDFSIASEQFQKISEAYHAIISNKHQPINNIIQIDHQELFRSMFSEMRMNHVSNISISRLPSQTTFTSKFIQIIDGKVIEKITEKKNGVTRTRTVIRDT